MRWLDGITNSMDMNLGEVWDMVRDRAAGVLQSTGLKRVRHDLATEQHQHRLQELRGAISSRCLWIERMFI